MKITTEYFNLTRQKSGKGLGWIYQYFKIWSCPYPCFSTKTIVSSKVHMDKDMIEKDITIGPVKIRPWIQLSKKEMKSQSLRTIWRFSGNE